MNNIMTYGLKVRMRKEMADIVFTPGKEVVDTENICSFLE
jgi:hypothetical protein